jgi:hypothetical protein
MFHRTRRESLDPSVGVPVYQWPALRLSLNSALQICLSVPSVIGEIGKFEADSRGRHPMYRLGCDLTCIDSLRIASGAEL